MTVKMTRIVDFSAGHRYWFANESNSSNRELFGAWASPFSHGHNYTLEVTVAGDVQMKTGMIVNIKDIDLVLKQRLLPQLNNKSINDEVSHFRTNAPTVENLLKSLWEEILLIGLPKAATLVGLKLIETPTLYGEYDGMKTTLTRTYEFAASHRLHAPLLTQDENDALFGKCNNPNGHGHNYVLEVTISGEPDARTGMICSLDDLDSVVIREVVDRYDHRNLNADIAEFANGITTSENVSRMIFDRLDAKVPATLERVRLYETARNMFEVSRP